MGFSVRKERINYALRLHTLGVPPDTICRKLGVSLRTFYAWEKEYSIRHDLSNTHEPEGRQTGQIAEIAAAPEQLLPDVKTDIT